MNPIRTLTHFFLILPLVLVGPLRADPPEDRNAWTSAPHGWHLENLGPRTESVGDFPVLLYVSVETGQGGSGDGSKKRPYQNLSAALSRGVQMTGNGEVAILVAQGTYTETPVQMKEGVHLFGGFDPVTWKRDIRRYRTVLDAEEQGRVVLGANDSTLDGFVIQRGRVVGPGGGLYCNQASPRVTNNIFQDNHAVEPDDFSHDHNRRRQRGHDGGAIGLEDFANPQIHHNLFIRNSTGVGYGAGIGARDDCIPQIGYNVFWGNQAGLGEVALTRSSNGAAIGLMNSSRAAVFHNLFVANEALGGSDGGAIFCEYFSWPEIRWNLFLNNYAGDDGGALDSQKFSHPKILYNLFHGNRADGSGGAIHHDDSLMDLVNNIFAYNTAEAQAGAFGGSHGWIKAINNTVVYNRAVNRSGGAVHHYNMKNPYLKPLFFRNNIFHGNEPDELFLESGGDVYYNIVQGGYGNQYGTYSIEPGFKENQVLLKASGVTFDPVRFQSRVELAEGTSLEPGAWKTRVIRLLDALEVEEAKPERKGIELSSAMTVITEEDGTQGDAPQLTEKRQSWWSMVVDNGEDWLTVWGPLPATFPADLEVIRTFHLAPDSPVINRGLYNHFAADDIDGEPRYTPTIDPGADEYVPESEF